MFCEKCGAQLADDSVFCEVCGADLSGGQPSGQPQVQEQYRQTEQPAGKNYTMAVAVGVIVLILGLAVSYYTVPTMLKLILSLGAAVVAALGTAFIKK